MRSWMIPLVFVVLLVGFHAVAADGPGLEAATLRLGRGEVLQRAASQGPGLLVARAGKASAAKSQDAADALLSLPPRLELDVARHTYPGGEGMDVTAALWQDLSLGGLGAAKRDFASAHADVRAIELDLARRQAVRNGMLAWIDAWHARMLLGLRTKSRDLAKQLVTVTRARVQAGSVPPVEESLAVSVLGGAKAAVLDAHGRMIEADARLRHALGLPPDQPVEIVGDLTRSNDRPVNARSLLARVRTDHALIKLAQANARQLDAQAELEASRGRPVLGVGVSYAHEATGDRILGAMVSLPLPVVNPSSLDSAVARGEADMARMRVQEVGNTLAREIRVALHEREHARELRAALRTGSLDPGKDALREVLRRYEGGAVGLAETLAVRRELLAVEEAYLAACADVHRADTNLAYIAGLRVGEEIR